MHAPLEKASFEEKGYAGPLRAFAPDVAAGHLGPIKELLGRPDVMPTRNRHIDTPFVADICMNERLVSAVSTLLGPNLLLWRTMIFPVSTRGPGHGWHQDSYQTLLELDGDALQCSVQLNFTRSTERNCVEIVPGSHKLSESRLSDKGFKFLPGSDQGAYGTPYWGIPPGYPTVRMELDAGEFYIFHSNLLHASLEGRKLTAPVVEAMSRPGLSKLVKGYNRTRLLLEKFRPEDIRYAIALRIVTPSAKILPGAFSQCPSRSGVIQLAGSNDPDVNQILVQ